jgi:hypothetical protein
VRISNTVVSSRLRIAWVTGKSRRMTTFFLARNSDARRALHIYRNLTHVIRPGRMHILTYRAPRGFDQCTL